MHRFFYFSPNSKEKYHSQNSSHTPYFLSFEKFLKKQITSCVRWVDVVNRLTEIGVTHAIEVGSGEVLTRLGRRITDGIEFLTYEEASDGGV